MPRRDTQHSVVQPHPLLLPPAALLRLRRGHGHGGSPASDAAAPPPPPLPLARNDRHPPFVVAGVGAEEGGGGLPCVLGVVRALFPLLPDKPEGWCGLV